IGELTEGRRWLDEAVRYFDEAIYRDSKWADPYVGLAETKLLLEQRGMVVKSSMHHRDGVYYEDAALEHLASALQHQPEYPAAVALLGRLLLDLDAPLFPQPLAKAIKASARHDANGPVPQLLLGRWLRKQGRLDQAAAAFRRYGELGGDGGLADLELARVLYLQGQGAAAVRTYLAGTARAGTLARTALRRDLTWFATDEELRRFDSLPPDSVGARVRQIWAERDAAALRPAGDRLREHLRRWWQVQEKFRLVGRGKKARFGWGLSGTPQQLGGDALELGTWALFQPGSLPESDPRALGIDARGVIYMRHGEPEARASWHGTVEGQTPSSCFAANESWKYELPTGPIVLHFCASEALGTTAPTSLVSMLPLSADMIGARSALDPSFARLELDLRAYELAVHLKGRLATNRSGAEFGPVAPGITQTIPQRARQFGEASLALGLATDTHPLDYERDLEPTVQVYAVGHPSGSGRALVVFALPGERLHPETLQGRVVYPVRMRVTAVDTARGHTRTLDTLRYFAAQDTIRKGAYLYGTLELPLTPGSYYVRALFEQQKQRAAGAAGRPQVPVPGMPGRLTMSDLITGAAGSGLNWTHRGRRISLNPLDSYPSGSDVELYYEISGTEPDRRYRTSVELARTGGGAGQGKDRIALGFTDRATARELLVQRAIGLGQLLPGRYLLTVRIEENATGRQVVRERMINVRAER
ncbi:MAG: hypothetical protein M3477_04590, partial [Gemmatimonadota bacterium]|nr:hypothetical protein [Gemmatimonadota bacterium]